jgi:hypothetical protein
MHRNASALGFCLLLERPPRRPRATTQVCSHQRVVFSIAYCIVRMTALALLKGETEPLGRRLPLRTAGSALGLGAGDTDSKRAPSSGEGYALLQDQHQEDVSMASSKDSERRYQEILTLAQSVQDLASLQNRLNVMIVEQVLYDLLVLYSALRLMFDLSLCKGEYLDRIDEHIERAKEQVISGKNELVKVLCNHQQYVVSSPFCPWYLFAQQKPRHERTTSRTRSAQPWSEVSSWARLPSLGPSWEPSARLNCHLDMRQCLFCKPYPSHDLDTTFVCLLLGLTE